MKGSIQSILGSLIERVIYLATALHIEASEIFSIICALGWALPLALQPWILDTSPYLRYVQAHVPYPVITGIAWTLFLYQVTGMLLGGLPSGVITDSGSHLRWMQARMIGMCASMLFWWFLSFLLGGTGVLTPGTIIHGGVGVICFWGALRLHFNIRVDRHYIELKALRDLVDAQTAHEEETEARSRQRVLA